MNRQCQGGYSLVLLLGVVSFVTLAGTYGSTLNPKWRGLMLEAQEVVQEKNRLIYYSVDYANLYGPAGAGPGHFPCPDTDLHGNLPGPNPPCGREAISIGQLPDGVSRRHGRIAFTDTFSKRSSYALSRPVVNNPAQAINFSQWPSEVYLGPRTGSGQGSNSVSNPNPNPNPNPNFGSGSSEVGLVRVFRPSGISRVIGKRSLERPTMRWVKAWLGSEIIRYKFRMCTKSLVDDRSKLSRHTSTKGSLQKTNSKLSFNCGKNINESLYQSLENYCDFDIKSLCVLHGKFALQWVLGEEKLDWQKVPINRHWFVRNGWVDLLSIKIDKICFEELAKCLLTTDDKNDLISVKYVTAEVTSYGQ